MEVLVLVVRPLILLLLVAVGYAVLFSGMSNFTKKLIRWVIIFIAFAALAMMFLPHGR